MRVCVCEWRKKEEYGEGEKKEKDTAQFSVEIMLVLVVLGCYVGQSVLSALSQWHDTIHMQEKGSKGVFVESYCEFVTKHLALTIWHSNIYWNYNVYWMMIDKWCHLKNLVLEDFLWADPSILKQI